MVMNDRKARVKCRTFRVSNLRQINRNKIFGSFVLVSIGDKCNVRPGPSVKKTEKRSMPENIISNFKVWQ